MATVVVGFDNSGRIRHVGVKRVEVCTNILKRSKVLQSSAVLMAGRRKVLEKCEQTHLSC